MDYQADLEAFKAEVKAIQLSCYSYLKLLNGLPREQLDAAGYKGKTNAEAMQMAFRDKEKQIERLTKEFLKKYPD